MVGHAINGHILDQVTANVVVSGRGLIAGIIQAVPFCDVAIEPDAEGVLLIHGVKSADKFAGCIENPKGDPA